MLDYTFSLLYISRPWTPRTESEGGEMTNQQTQTGLRSEERTEAIHGISCDLGVDCVCGADMELIRGDALDLISQLSESPDLIATDPPYAFGGSGDEHALSATVAVVLREAAARLRRGRWMLVMCAASWRSTAYMVESVRGIVDPVRIATWCKPHARTKVSTSGWLWASVNVIAFRKGKAEDPVASGFLDHITAAPVMNGRRAELPPEVAAWMVAPYAVSGGLFLDPFAGSGALVKAAEDCGMRTIGYERKAA